MSTRKGRKKAAAKPAAPVVQDEQPELTTAELQTTTKPAAPPSPIVALAKQALTPVVAAAKRAASTIVAALPAIPEASAVDAAGLDIDQQQQLLDSPRSPTGQRNPFSEPPSSLHDDLSLQDDDAAPGSDQQQHGMHSSVSQQRDELDEELEPLQDRQQKATAAALVGQLKQQALLQLQQLSTWVGAQRSSGLLPVLALSLLLLAGLCGTLFLQGSSLQAQHSTITHQQQQVAAQQTALVALQEQLQQAQQQLQAMPDMQQLQDAASSCKAGLGDLGSSQDSLQGTLDSLAALAGQLQADVSSLSQASALGEKAWQLLESAKAASGLASATAAVVAPALPQQAQQQRALTEQLQQSKAVLDTLPATIKQEVKQQLTVALPPVDLALADCGGRIVFHTPLNTTALAAETAAAGGGLTAAGGASSALGAMQWLQQQVVQWLLPSSVAAAQQQRPLLSAAHINNIILRPQGAFPASTALAGKGAAPSQRSIPCLPLLLAPGDASAAAAVLEIALPQLAAVQSVTFHHAAGAYAGQLGSNSTAPGVLQIAFANSSSCPAGVCSAVGHAALLNSTATNTAAVAADGTVSGHVSNNGVLAPGAVGVQQEVHLEPDSFASGRAVVKVQQAAAAAAAAAAGDELSSSSAAAVDGAGGVVADRVIVHVSSALGGGGGVCMQRISVQGVPLDPAGFC